MPMLMPIRSSALAEKLSDTGYTHEIIQRYLLSLWNVFIAEKARLGSYYASCWFFEHDMSSLHLPLGSFVQQSVPSTL